MTFYVLAPFDPADPHSFTGKVRKNLTIDKATIAYKTASRPTNSSLRYGTLFRETHFLFLLPLLQLQNHTHSSPLSSFAQLIQDQEEQQQRNLLSVSSSFPCSTRAMCSSGLCSCMPARASELCKIKQRQKDVLANVRMDRSGMFRSTASVNGKSKGRPAPCNDITMLYSLIGILYVSLLPERDLQFWGTTPPGESNHLFTTHKPTSSAISHHIVSWT
jgi:nuclear pore complex protein Nup205